MREWLDPLTHVFSHGATTTWSMITTFLWASAAYVVISTGMWLAATKGQKRAISGARDFIFPVETYTNRTAVIDRKHALFSIFLWAPLLSILFSLWAGVNLSALLNEVFGAVRQSVLPKWAIVLEQSAAIILARDLGFWVGHYLTHKVPFLWQLHRAHHSAEELNLFTSYRVHPLDQLFVRSIVVIFGALAAGLSFYGFGIPLLSETVFAIAAFSVVQEIKGLFDHSPIWLSFGPLNRIFCAPVMHQIHHSAELRHRDKNMAEMFTLWDWMFGTLYVPAEKEEFTKGIDASEAGELNPHRTLQAFYAEPVANCARMIAGKPLPVPSVSATSAP